jgi:hypothetical protein
MRRTVLECVDGYEALKDEAMEDVRLAEMIKAWCTSVDQVCAKPAQYTDVSKFQRDVGVQYQELVLGDEAPLPLVPSCFCSMYLLAVGPPLLALASAVGIAAGFRTDLWLLFIPAALSWLLQVLVLAMVSKFSEVSPTYAMTAPLGLGLLYAMLFDSSIRITTGKGVTWKGRRIYESNGVRPPRIGAAAPHVSNLEE